MGIKAKFCCVSLLILSFLSCGKSQIKKASSVNSNTVKDTITNNNYFSFKLKHDDLEIYGQMLEIDFSKLKASEADSILKVMYNWDQKYRGITVRDFNRKQPNDFKKLITLLKKRKKIDSINYLLLRNITNKFGWPNNKEFSLAAIDGAFFTILHMNGKNGENSKVFESDIEKAFQNKQISSYHYAVMIDHILLKNREQQKYGTHCRNVKGELLFYNMDDLEKVNLSRKDIGLAILNNNTCEIMSR